MVVVFPVQSPKERWKLIPSFVTEGRVRKAIQTLYDSLALSLENAAMIAEKQPDELKALKGFGTHDTQGAFRFYVRWLCRFQEYAAAKEIFESQVLEPARISARFRRKVAEFRPSSASLEGFVFSAPKSRFYRGFESEGRTVSMVVPELRTCLNLRHTIEILGDVKVGNYEFGGVMPVPLVNRIHPVRISVKRKETPVSIAGMDFLMVNISDLENVSRSIAYEKLCIVASNQMGGERLGLPCILSGQLVSASGPELVLRDIASSRVVRLIVSDDFHNAFQDRHQEIHSLEGKFVNVLAVLWYGRKASPDSKIWPEAYWAEQASGENEVRLNNLIGYVRFRGRVSPSNLKAAFPWLDVDDLPSSLSMEAESVTFHRGERSQDRVNRCFMESADEIANLRLRGPGDTNFCLTKATDLLDKSKLRAEGVAESIGANRHLFDSLCAIIARSDETGELGTPKDLLSCFPHNGGQPSETLWWFRDLGVLQRAGGTLPDGRNDKRLKISVAGNQIISLLLHSLAEERLSRAVRSLGPTFTLLSASRATQLPASITLEALRAMEVSGGVACSVYQRKRFELVWLGEGQAHGSPTERETVRIPIERVLSHLAEFPQGVSQSFVVSYMKQMDSSYGFLSVGLILDVLRETGHVKLQMEAKGNRMWSYPLYSRTRDVVLSHTDEILSFQRLMELTKARSVDADSLRQAVTRLKSEGMIVEGADDTWAAGSLPDFKLRLLKREVLDYTKRAIKEEGGSIDSARLRYYVSHYILKSFASFHEKFGINWSESEAWDRADSLIAEMLSKGEIVSVGTRIRVPQ